ncbi:MAG: alanine racemase, partial [Acidobacteria bacterium]|nr:alanine racemase [Acidobacteriota bacterium]
MSEIFTRNFNLSSMSEIQSHRPTVAKIDLDALARNFHSVKKFVGEQVSYMAVVKADAYGHGAVECAKRLESEGADWFAVALPEEGVELRDAGISKSILCFGGCWPGQEDALLDRKITPVIFTLETAKRFDDAAKSRDLQPNIHVKIDTGMGRVGVPWREAAAFAKELSSLSNLNVQGMMTHFASADDLAENDFTNAQIERLENAVSVFRECGFSPEIIDLANSPGAVAHPN